MGKHPPRPCLGLPGEPPCPSLTNGTRCAQHERTYQQRRNAARTGWYGGDWQRIRRNTIEAWVAEHGWTCPGWQVPAHVSHDLTADHVEARSLAAGVRVLCRSCNSRRGNHQRYRGA